MCLSAHGTLASHDIRTLAQISRVCCGVDHHEMTNDSQAVNESLTRAETTEPHASAEHLSDPHKTSTQQHSAVTVQRFDITCPLML
jgi:hypothetical protein